MVILFFTISTLTILAVISMISARKKDQNLIEEFLPEEKKFVPSKEYEQEVKTLIKKDQGGSLQKTSVTPWVSPTIKEVGIARRQFLNRSIIAMLGLGFSSFGAAVIAQLWPQSKGGFGSEIRVGNISDILLEIRSNNGFLYRPEGRMWITEFPAEALEKAAPVYKDTTAWTGIEAGVKAIFQKCPHLGCRVPECRSSQYFECPCHGSFYNRVGEKRGGPAPRGMDFFGTSITNGVLIVDTRDIIFGPDIGVDSTGQEREGPSCLGASTH